MPLHYCSIDDVITIMPVAGRYSSVIEDIRNGVTDKINRYIRRDLEYRENFIEYFDIPALRHGRSINLWLEKKNVIPNSLVLHYSRDRAFEDVELLTQPHNYVVDYERGRITLYGYLYGGTRSLRITYDGGFPELMEGEAPDLIPTGIMNVPASLKRAAIDQCVFEANGTLNLNQGKSEDEDKGQKIPISTIDGLLISTVNAFANFRKPLGR
jgi:hypothetical protein